MRGSGRGVPRRALLAAVLTLALVLAGLRLPTSGADFTGTTGTGAQQFSAAADFHPYRSAVLADGPAFYHRLDDAAGSGVLGDASGQNRPGANPYPGDAGPVLGSPGAVTSGTAARLSPAGGRVTSRAPFTGTTAMSVEFWFRSPGPGGLLSRLVADPADPASPVRLAVYVDSAGRVTFAAWDSGTAAFKSAQSSARVDYGSRWHHVVATVNATALSLTLDGAVTSTTLTHSAPSGSWVLGGGRTAWPAGMPRRPVNLLPDVLIDEFAVYPAVLSTTQRTAHRTAGASGDYPAAVLADAPSLYWRLDETVGATTAADGSGAGRVGDYTLGPDAPAAADRWAAAGAPVGDGDGAAFLDGSVGAVVRADPDPAPSADYGVELWFRTDAPGGGLLAGAVDRPRPAGSANRLLYVDADGRLTYGDDVAGTGVVTVRSAGRVDDGAWHHVAAGHGGSTLELYLDGVLVGSTTAPPQSYGGRWVVGGAGVAFTGWPDRPANAFLRGTVDEFAAYRSAPTPARVAAHRAAAGTGDYPAAVLADAPAVYWRLSEAFPAPTAADASGNGVTGAYGLASVVAGGRPGALPGPRNDAVWLSGVYANAYQQTSFGNPGPFTAEVWVRTTTTFGGVVFGFAEFRDRLPVKYDRHVWMRDDGRLAFGVYPGATKIVTSAVAYNDGQWHHVVASVGAAGQRLYVDGVPVAADATVTTAQDYVGWWRLGGAIVTSGGWGAAASHAWNIAAFVDEFAVYPVQLTDERVAAHFAAR